MRAGRYGEIILITMAIGMEKAYNIITAGRYRKIILITMIICMEHSENTMRVDS